MKRVMRMVLLALAAAYTSACDSRPPEAIAERNVRVLLYAHHGAPSREVFERAAPDAKQRLLALASDPRAGVLRDRALMALASFGDEDVRALYEGILSDRTAVLKTRRVTQHAYRRAFNADPPAALLDVPVHIPPEIQTE